MAPPRTRTAGDKNPVLPDDEDIKVGYEVRPGKKRGSGGARNRDQPQTDEASRPANAAAPHGRPAS
ncbi:hypothetical protein [Streptomyces sp. NPDC017964]|uniref:hypothetical protein n=1 Tax=Streptomyces sp. NPDC017964 TaxID=3365022 RepID=UPI0037BA0A5E